MVLKKGVFTLSLDTELSWGTVDKSNKRIKNKFYYENTREVIYSLLNLMEKYNISATWAIVGHLFLEREELINSLNENDIRFKNISLWYGRNIIKKIKSSKVYQEIGCHSFSHMLFTDKDIKKDILTKEIKRCIDEANKMGIKLESFIFPRNKVGYINELIKGGFETFRGIEPNWYSSYNPLLKKGLHIIDQVLAISPPVNTPKQQGGILNIPASMLYLPMNGFRRYVPLKSRILKSKKGIKRAISEKKVFHLWFHPYNIATNKEKLLYGLEVIFKEVDKERKKGNIEVKTMGEVNKLFKKRIGLYEN
ncbi:MAG: hypothetical protein FH753_10045 [Firmicutes bacterium]|nr:hypothetical protein [Bacillota bacterium]